MDDDRGPKLVAGPAMTGPGLHEQMTEQAFEQQRRERQAEMEAIDIRNRETMRLLRNVVEGKPDVMTAARDFFAYAQSWDAW